MNKLLMSALGVSTVAIAGLAVSTSAQALTFPNSSTCQSGSVAGFTDCAGRVTGANDAQSGGNPLLSELNDGITPSWKGIFANFKENWTFLGKSDDSSFGPFTSNPSGNAGTLSFDTLLNGTYAISLKAGNGFNVYLLENLVDVGSLDFSKNTGKMPVLR